MKIIRSIGASLQHPKTRRVPISPAERVAITIRSIERGKKWKDVAKAVQGKANFTITSSCRDKYNMLKVKIKKINRYEVGASGKAVEKAEEEQEVRNLVKQYESPSITAPYVCGEKSHLAG